MPRPLRYALNAQRYGGALPLAGGQLDQRYGDIDRMNWAYDVYRAVMGYEGATGMARLDWIDHNPALADINGDVRIMQRKRDAAT